MVFWFSFAVCLLLSFLSGSLPVGLWIGALHGVDVRKAGSGNPGAMNVGRILGKQWFAVVFVLDLLKGLAPTLLAGLVLATAAEGEVGAATRMICRLMVGLGAILGHNYSPFLDFRGGKGVSTSLGVALGIYPDLTFPALLSFSVWVLGIGLTRMSSVGSIAGGLFFPVFYLFILRWRGGSVADHWPFVIFTVIVAMLVLVRHKGNIVRILAGTEAKVVRG